MDKPLPENKKEPQAQPSDARSSLGDGTVGAYNPELTTKKWEQSAKPWNASPQGRLAIRLVSRGVLGAAFFAVGGQLATKWMRNYDAEANLLKQENPLGVISKLIDTGVGKPIEFAVNTFGGHGAQAVRFRPTANVGRWGDVAGRSLGHETSMVTFDFFCASIGDALGRDIAGWVDPDVKKHWMKDGHIEWPQAIKQAMKSTWRYVSYNGGEDWAVAIPYVYFMKAHRKMVNHFSPGFAYDFDRNLNGGSQKIHNGEVVGNYNRAGIFDLQNRFVVYNMGTVAYRELYNFAGDTFKGKKAVLYGSPDKEEVHDIGTKAANAVKWMARSVIKAGIYMTPAVPFFWITRTPQTKFRAGYIDAEKGMLVNSPDHPRPDHVPGNHVFDPKKPYFHARYDEASQTMQRSAAASGIMKGGKPFTVYESEKGLLNSIGKGAYKTVSTVGNVASKADTHFGEFGNRVKDRLGLYEDDKHGKRSYQSFRGLSNTYANAAIAYTPYMYAKAEFANLWDDGKMDMSIERAIDGVAKLNFGEFTHGLREIGHAIMHKPLPEPEREIMAQHRIELDTSAADNFTETKKEMQQDAVHKNLLDHKPPGWSERMVHAGSTRKVKEQRHKNSSFAEQEEMKRALQELDPPTPSVH